MDLTIFDIQTLQGQMGTLVLPDTVEAFEANADVFNAEAAPKGFGFSPKDYWHALKKEMHILICGKNDKYDDLRIQIAQHGKCSQTAIIGMISVFVGTQINVEAGFLMPFIAMMLAMGVRVGTEAFCRVLDDAE